MSKDEKSRHRILGLILFVLYLILLIYFLFSRRRWEEIRRCREGYSYNLTLFKEIRRFYEHREILGYRALFLNIFGNVLAFMPFGFFLPMIWKRTDRLFLTAVSSFLMSLCIETGAAGEPVGSFDVDDLLLNTIGGVLGFLAYRLLRGVWIRY